MLTINTMILIAIWCGNPNNGTVRLDEVNKCRKELLKCIKESPGVLEEVKVEKCIKEQELK